MARDRVLRARSSGGNSVSTRSIFCAIGLPCDTLTPAVGVGGTRFERARGHGPTRSQIGRVYQFRQPPSRTVGVGVLMSPIVTRPTRDQLSTRGGGGTSDVNTSRAIPCLQGKRNACSYVIPDLRPSLHNAGSVAQSAAFANSEKWRASSTPCGAKCGQAMGSAAPSGGENCTVLPDRSPANPLGGRFNGLCAENVTSPRRPFRQTLLGEIGETP